MLPITVRRRKQYARTRQSSRLTQLDARGHYTIGKEMVDSVIDRIRRVAGKIQSAARAYCVLTQLRQLLVPPGFPDLPLLRWWYGFWFRCPPA
jgi:hypothetical protein